MLTYDALIQAARDRGMPQSKMRGILREYLEVLILKELYRLETGRKFFFTGGTYLRLVHQTKRFSEDLYFNAKKLSRTEFENTLAKIVSALGQEGIHARLEFRHWQNLWVAELIFPDVERFYGITSKHSKKEGIRIKVECYRPQWEIVPETLLVKGYGEMFPVICTQRGALFADKVDAILKKNRVRHLFDLMFMLATRYPIDAKVLKALGVQDPPLQAVLQRVMNFSDKELGDHAESLRPFLFDEHEADLIRNAKSILKQLTEQYEN